MPLVSLASAPTRRGPRGAAPSGLLFETSWLNGGTGTSETALTDNGLFDGVGGNGLISGTPTLDIVSGASVGADVAVYGGGAGNVVRMRMRQGCFGQLFATNILPESTDWFYRDYVMSEAQKRSNHGSFVGGTSGGFADEHQLLAMVHAGGDTDGGLLQYGLVAGLGGAADLFRTPNSGGDALSKGVWYRREIACEYNPGNGEQFRLYYRFYNTAGALLIDNDLMLAEDNQSLTLTAQYLSTPWMTLGAGSETPAPEYARTLFIGLEDPADATGYNPATPAYLYQAKVALSLNDWIGP